MESVLDYISIEMGESLAARGAHFVLACALRREPSTLRAQSFPIHQVVAIVPSGNIVASAI